MKKKYLLKYESPQLHVLADYSVYLLHVETVYFWGLFKTNSIVKHKIYAHESFKTFFNHWDELIKNKTALL